MDETKELRLEKLRAQLAAAKMEQRRHLSKMPSPDNLAEYMYFCQISARNTDKILSLEESIAELI